MMVCPSQRENADNATDAEQFKGPINWILLSWLNNIILVQHGKQVA